MFVTYFLLVVETAHFISTLDLKLMMVDLFLLSSVHIGLNFNEQTQMFIGCIFLYH